MTAQGFPRAAMVFAAGFGTRMAPLSTHTPKPLIEVAGQPLLAHALDALDPAKLERIVINTHYLADQIAAWVQAQGRGDLRLSHEPQLLDTGGGLWAARQMLGPGPAVTMNADAVWRGPAAASPLIDAWRPGQMDVLLLLVPKARAVGHLGPGDFDLGPEGQLLRRGAAPSAAYIYTGVSITDQDLLDIQKDGQEDGQEDGAVFSLNRPWDRAIAKARAFGVVYPGHWADVGQPQSIPLAEAMVTG
ncbi:MAG: nucleotidyltransferase family protein [Pseudomonadota bacterium]